MKNKSGPRLALIIPAYNEETVLRGVINGLIETFDESSVPYEIVVVDDGSKDNTSTEASAAQAFVIRHILNTGSGGATATGLSYAQQNGFQIAATIDADGQHSPEDVLKGVKLIEKDNHDLLIGSRLIDNEGMSRVKRIGNKGLSFITYLLFGVKVTDSQSGLRVFSKKALDELRWKTSGYEFASEMLWRAKQQGLRIGEYPIKAIYTDYSKTKGQNNWNAVNIIKSLLKTRILELFGE
jgi:UDP-N-acetylglucosamine---dolichyl-phosphate N-acetylglucosaminyltransferase